MGFPTAPTVIVGFGRPGSLIRRYVAGFFLWFCLRLSKGLSTGAKLRAGGWPKLYYSTSFPEIYFAVARLHSSRTRLQTSSARRPCAKVRIWRCHPFSEHLYICLCSTPNALVIRLFR